MSPAKKKQNRKVTKNATSALISRERSSIKCSIKGALVASISFSSSSVFMLATSCGGLHAALPPPASGAGALAGASAPAGGVAGAIACARSGAGVDDAGAAKSFVSTGGGISGIGTEISAGGATGAVPSATGSAGADGSVAAPGVAMPASGVVALAALLDPVDIGSLTILSM